MEKVIEMQAASAELAIEKALAELNASREEVEVEVLSKGGLFSKAKVKVTLRRGAKDMLAEFINGALERMGLKSRATAEEREGTIYVTISGEDTQAAIGFRGEALDAFQYLALTFLNEHKCEFKKVVIDAENYREKRKETLTALAHRLAQKAVRLRKKVALEPMNPFERRVIHSALSEDETVTTMSEGEEPNRYVVIIPVGVELKDARPIKCYEHEKNDRRGRGKRDDRGHRDNKDRKPRAKRERKEEEEVEDGNVYRGYILDDDFKKPAPQGGPPKFKSFGGKKGIK